MTLYTQIFANKKKSPFDLTPDTSEAAIVSGDALVIPNNADESRNWIGFPIIVAVRVLKSNGCYHSPFPIMVKQQRCSWPLDGE